MENLSLIVLTYNNFILGRILHHMDENQNFDPVTTKLLILDEADR